uniref:Si:ch1073-406l10.2 n=1 Tax=Hippocampus comes TaxID=109280 RepID=A0A3Q3DHQ9_HIPCM
MAALFLLLTVGVTSLCASTQAQEAYGKLEETFRKGVDLSLEKLSEHAAIQNHFLFFKSVTKSNVEAGFDVVFIYHRFYLKATRCPKGTEDPAGCTFRNDVVSGPPKQKKMQRDNLAELFSPVSFQPMIDCAICYKTFQGDIEAEPKPYLNCLRKPSVTPEVQASRMEQCNRLAYSSGGTNLLASTGTK